MSREAKELMRRAAESVGATYAQVKDGVNVEQEFNNSFEDSLRAVVDHLKISKDYYGHLFRMEMELKKKKDSKASDRQVRARAAEGTKAAKGTMQQVWDGVALKTAGGLTKADLVLNKAGKPVSKKRSENAKKLQASGKLKNIAN
jgi:hypothetical protein